MIAASAALMWHQAFETSAMLAGGRYYVLLKRRSGAGVLSAGNFAVGAGCLAGAALGNKLAYWLQVPQLLAQHWREPLILLFGGQSIVGGLVGGLIGVEAAKKLAGVRESTGDFFVFPLLLGIMIGRIGCYIAGLRDDTCGIATGLPWGHDFGDGVARHPTQIYEILFCGVLWVALRRVQPRLRQRPGLLFKCFLCAYLAWRLAVDFLKPVPWAYPGGLSGIQLLCLATLLVYLPLCLRQARLPPLRELAVP